jgi:hypothetical protein
MFVGDIELSDYPRKEDIEQEIERTKAQVASSMHDLEILLKIIYEGQTYMNEEEVKKFMHSSSIPQGVTYYRWGRERVYSLKDIKDYLAAKKTE